MTGISLDKQRGGAGGGGAHRRRIGGINCLPGGVEFQTIIISF